MELTKITSKGQATIPKKVRQALGLRQGDLLRFDVNGNHAVLSKVAVAEDGYLKGVEAGLSEWTSQADEDAYGDL